jgi:uncharacterized membrane protein
MIGLELNNLYDGDMLHYLLSWDKLKKKLFHLKFTFRNTLLP